MCAFFAGSSFVNCHLMELEIIYSLQESMIVAIVTADVEARGNHKVINSDTIPLIVDAIYN